MGILDGLGDMELPMLAATAAEANGLNSLKNGQNGNQENPLEKILGNQFFTEMKNFVEAIEHIFKPEVTLLFKEFMQLGESMLGIDPKEMKQFATANAKTASPDKGPESDSAPSPTK